MPKRKDKASSAAQPRKWYEIRNQGGQAEILVYGDIGQSFWGEESITAKQFIDELGAIGNIPVTVRINSYGGSASDGMAIHNAMRNHPADISVIVDGVAVSAASIIAMGGDTIAMHENSLMMIHAPWGLTMGNSVEHRQAADMLDKFGNAMATAYSSKTGMSNSDVLGQLLDGLDHWFTAAEALDQGLTDSVIPSRDSAPTSAAAAQVPNIISRFPLPAAVAAHYSQEKLAMPAKKGNDQATSDLNSITHEDSTASERNGAEKDNVIAIERAAIARREGEIRARNDEAREIFRPFMHNPSAKMIYDDLLSDPQASLESARNKLLDTLGKDSVPAAGQAAMIRDERDGFRMGAGDVLAYRMGIGKDDRANNFRGMRVSQILAHGLAMNGVDVKGLRPSDIADVVFAGGAGMTTSDLPNLLVDALNKRLQVAYETFPKTWQQWCGIGQVSDFKTINLIRMGSFNSLDTIPENEPYTQGSVGDEKQTLSAVTKGKYIQFSRQMIINDDLSGFSRMAAMLGNAAARTVNADAYGILTANGALTDGVALFHATHANLAGTAGAITVATLSAARSAMRKQTAPGSNATEYLNIMPKFLLVPVGLEDTANEIVRSATNVDTTSSRKINPISQWSPLTVVSDPVLDADSTTAYYLVADPMIAPLVEVMFLDGVQTPYVGQNTTFLVDAMQWKVRMDYGVSGNDFRGGYKNAGA